MLRKMIESSEWRNFLSGFSDRNSGRRARFEAFTTDGVAEEDEEAAFQNVTIDGTRAVIDRVNTHGKLISDTVEDVRGISIQYDSDDSENTMEFADSNGNMTVLHFESMVDGES